MKKIKLLGKKTSLVQVVLVAAMIIGLGYFFLKPEAGEGLRLYALVHVGDITYVNDVFEHTFTLTNGNELDVDGNPVAGTAMTLPDLDDSDGTVVRVYKSYRMSDQAGNKVQGCDMWTTQSDCINHGCGWFATESACSAYEFLTDSELVASGTTPLSINLPVQTTTPSGWYSTSAILFKVEQTWDRTTNTWSMSDPVILDKQAVKFEVQTPTPPPRPGVSAIMNWLGNLFASIVQWIRGLFGWT